MLLFAFVCGCRFATAFLSNIHRLEHNNNPLVPRSDGYYSAWKSEERLPPTQAVSIRSFFSAVSQSKPTAMFECTPCVACVDDFGPLFT